MKRVFYLLLIAVLLSSCGIFRNVKKEKYKHEVSIKETSDSTEKIESTSLDQGKSIEIDKGTIITEKETTHTTKKEGAKVDVNADIVKLKSGETITKDSAGIRVSIMLDSLSNQLKVSVLGA